MKYHESTELCHHGIKGQRWGVRRFQNPDGTRTAAGKAREKELNKRKKNPIGDSLTRYGDIPYNSIDAKNKVEMLFPNECPKTVIEAFGNLTNNPLTHKYKDDCSNVFLAFEGRARGFDVKPGDPKKKGGLKYADVCSCFIEKVDEHGNSCFDNSKKNVTSKRQIEGFLSDYPDGSRGYLSGTFTVEEVTYKHAVSWSKENRKVTFGDGVNGLNTDIYFEGIVSTKPIQYFRSDNLTLDMDVYLKYVES